MCNMAINIHVHVVVFLLISWWDPSSLVKGLAKKLNVYYTIIILCFPISLLVMFIKLIRISPMTDSNNLHVYTSNNNNNYEMRYPYLDRWCWDSVEPFSPSWSPVWCWGLQQHDLWLGTECTCTITYCNKYKFTLTLSLPSLSLCRVVHFVLECCSRAWLVMVFTTISGLMQQCLQRTHSRYSWDSVKKSTMQ